jgi:hypothetical protein
MQEVFQVAIDEENRAKDAVRIAAKLVNDAPVEVAGHLVVRKSGGFRLSPERSGRSAELFPCHPALPEEVSDYVVIAHDGEDQVVGQCSPRPVELRPASGLWPSRPCSPGVRGAVRSPANRRSATFDGQQSHQR